jgi:hypothetical protein
LCGTIVKGTLKNGILDVTFPKDFKIDALLHYLPSLQLWLLPKVPTTFVPSIIKGYMQQYI